MMSNAFRLLSRRMCGWTWTAAAFFSRQVSEGADAEVCMRLPFPRDTGDDGSSDEVADTVESSSESESRSRSAYSPSLRGRSSLPM